MIVTELTKLLGIRVPVVQGGMQWVRPSAFVTLPQIDLNQVGLPPLVAAVSNAGGLVRKQFASVIIESPLIFLRFLIGHPDCSFTTQS